MNSLMPQAASTTLRPVSPSSPSKGRSPSPMIPGNQQPGTDPASPPYQTHVLDPESELRYEIGAGNTSHVTLKLARGQAEIFGGELAPHKEYTLHNTKGAIFTFQGCELHITGEPDSLYTSTETPMVSYINTHAGIERLRRIAAASPHATGPRVLVVGSGDVGKSSLVRTLLNYAVRCGHKPLFVDLDIGQGQITIPGMVAALPVDRPTDPCGFTEAHFVQQQPLVFCNGGHISISANGDLYKHVMGRLASAVKQRFVQNDAQRVAGCVINTCGWIDGLGYESMKEAISVFAVDVICVLDSEKLYNDLKVYTKGWNPPVAVVKLAKSGGVVQRSPAYRSASRDQRIREYFYGLTGDLNPFSMILKFDRVDIYKIGAPAAPSSCLPLGFIPEKNETKHVPVLPSEDLLNSILAVSSCDSLKASSSSTTTTTTEGGGESATAPKDPLLVDFNIVGYILVTKVDMARKEFTILSPAPGVFPKRYLLTTDVKWSEQ